MYTRMVAEKFGELQFTSVLPSSLEALMIPGATAQVSSGAYGHVLFQELQSNGFTVWHKSYLLNQATTISCTGKDPVLVFQLSLNNSLCCQYNELGDLIFHERGYNITYLPSPQSQLQFYGKGTYKMAEIHFTIEFLHRLSSFFPVLTRFLQEVTQQQPCQLVDINQIATQKILTIMQHMLYSGYSHEALNIFLESKSTEILLVSLEQITHHPTLSPIRLSPLDAAQVYHARDLMLNDLQKEWTNQELAQQVSLSSFKLKSNFRKLFGIPIGEYLRDARMGKARQLVDDSGYTLDIIARMTGFKSLASFSKSYKKYFGMLPVVRVA